MSVPCNKKTVTITVPDEIDKKYGSDTWKDNGFYYVDPQYDPAGLFDGWYFYRAEIKSDKNGDDKLKKNRIQLQVPAGTNDDNNGAFVTGTDPVRRFENREDLVRGCKQQGTLQHQVPNRCNG